MSLIYLCFSYSGQRKLYYFVSHIMQMQLISLILEAQRDVKYSLLHLLPQSLTSRLAFSTISSSFLLVAGVKMPGIGEVFSDFRELSLCGPCGPCFFQKICLYLYSQVKPGASRNYTDG